MKKKLQRPLSLARHVDLTCLHHIKLVQSTSQGRFVTRSDLRSIRESIVDQIKIGRKPSPQYEISIWLHFALNGIIESVAYA